MAPKSIKPFGNHLKLFNHVYFTLNLSKLYDCKIEILHFSIIIPLIDKLFNNLLGFK